MPWYQKNPQELISLKAKLKEIFPTLRITENDGNVVVKGMFPVITEAGKLLSEYSVEITLPDDYPHNLPIIRELQGKIPRTADWHTSAPEGTLCIVLPAAYWQKNNECQLDIYLKNEVNGYFIAADYYRLKGYWPFGEHKHGIEGYTDYYGERLGIKDQEVILIFMADLIKNRLKGDNVCPCHSGKKLRICHAAILWQLRKEMPENRIESIGPPFK